MIINWEQFISKVPLVFNRRQLMQALFASSAAVFAINSKAAHAVAPAQAAVAIDAVFLLRMAKDIYPHDDFLDDKPYLDVVNSTIKEAQGDTALKKMLVDGIDNLNKSSQQIHGKPYVDVPSYGSREALLRSVELTDFFQKIRGGLLFGLYNNKALFPKFGYEGSSWEEGGYIDRGFSDMTWLPEDPRQQGDKK